MQKVMICAILLKFPSFGAFIQYFAWVGPTMKLISAIYIPKCNFWCMAKGGYSTKKNYLQKVDWGQSRSQNWRKTLKIFGKKFYTFIIISIKRKSVGGYSRCSTKFCLLWHYLPRYPLSYDSPEMLSNQSPIEPTFI